MPSIPSYPADALLADVCQSLNAMAQFEHPSALELSLATRGSNLVSLHLILSQVQSREYDLYELREALRTWRVMDRSTNLGLYLNHLGRGGLSVLQSTGHGSIALNCKGAGKPWIHAVTISSLLDSVPFG